MVDRPARIARAGHIGRRRGVAPFGGERLPDGVFRGAGDDERSPEQASLLRSGSSSRRGFSGAVRGGIFSERLTGAEGKPIQRPHAIQKLTCCLGKTSCLRRNKLS